MRDLGNWASERYRIAVDADEGGEEAEENRDGGA
jgi:endogenous inhibitor of DNA gyrase (YacG/DUF329 family)